MSSQLRRPQSYIRQVRIAFGIFAVWTGLAVFSGCSPGLSEGGTIAVCGQYLFSGAELPGLYHVPNHGQNPPTPTLSIGRVALPLLVQVSSDCENGTDVSISPSGLVQVQALYGRNGKPVALYIIGDRPGTATLIVGRGRKLLGGLSFSIVR